MRTTTRPGTTTATIDVAAVTLSDGRGEAPGAGEGQQQQPTDDGEVLQELGHVGAALGLDHVPERVPEQRGTQHEQGEQQRQRAGVEAQDQQYADQQLHDHGDGRRQHGRGRAQGGHVADRAFETAQFAPAGEHEQDHQQDASDQQDDVALTVEQAIAHGGAPVDRDKFHSSSCVAVFRRA